MQSSSIETANLLRSPERGSFPLDHEGMIP